MYIYISLIFNFFSPIKSFLLITKHFGSFSTTFINGIIQYKKSVHLYTTAFSIYRLIQWSRIKMNCRGLSTMVLICIKQINESINYYISLMTSS